MKKLTHENFRDDILFSRVEKAFAKILSKGTILEPIEIFVEMGLLTSQKVSDWRFGRVSSLERVVGCNLSKASRILRILRYYAHDLNMRPSHTVYMKWGKGRKIRLQFSKTGNQKLEQCWSTKFLVPGKEPAKNHHLKDKKKLKADGSSDLLALAE